MIHRLKPIFEGLRRRAGFSNGYSPEEGVNSSDNISQKSEVPPHLLRNQRTLSERALAKVERSLREHYHIGWRGEASYTKEAYEKDLRDHLTGRLRIDRRYVVPWLDDVCSLRNRRILEIGCGTGSSTLALAEQGAQVVGVDIDEAALQVARDRCAAFDVPADFVAANADSILDTFKGSSFETVIFFATLEHMTIAERLRSLEQAWCILPPGGLLVVVDTPNRLWYMDSHTSFLPFFNWLPNELAFLYSRMSPRENFRELYREYSPDAKLHFLRRGRGVSFHELELAIAPIPDLQVVSSLRSFNPQARKYSDLDNTFKSALMQVLPELYEGFYDKYLELIIRKS